MTSCTYCNTTLPNLDDICAFPDCGHILHQTCVIPEYNEDKIMTCKVRSCKTKTKKKHLINIIPFYGNDVDQSFDRYPKCNICADSLRDIQNICVTKCHHMFHYNCAMGFTKRTRSPEKGSKICPAPHCIGMLTPCNIFKLNLMPYSHKNRRSFDNELPKGESVVQMIQESFDNNSTITKEDAQKLELEIFKCNIKKWEMMKLEDKAAAQKLFQFDEKKYLKQNCDNCADNLIKINVLQKKLSNVKAQRKRYHKGKQHLNDKFTSEIADLRQENAQKIIEIDELKKAIEEFDSEETIKALKDDLHKANSEILRLCKERENSGYEQQETQRNVTALEDDIRNESLQNEIQQLKSENVALKEQNDQMQRDLAAVNEDFAKYDADITELLMREETTILQNEIHTQHLYEQINTLNQCNGTLKQFNEQLMKQLRYQGELITRLST